MENLNEILMGHKVALLAFITLAFLLAGLVKGVIGLGLPTVAVGLLSVTMTPLEAASILVVPSLVTNVWQLLAGPSFKPLLDRLWTMLLGICVGTILGGVMLPKSGSNAAVIGLGIALMLYAFAGLKSIRLPIPRQSEPWLSPVIGMLTGAVTAATGIFVVPAVPYLQGLGFGKDDLVQALGLAFTISTVALAAGLAMNGAFKPGVASISLYALVPALAGMFLGQWIRGWIQSETFRKCFFIGLLALGLSLAVKASMQ